MSEHDKKRKKTWRQFAADVSREPNSNRVAQLSQELIKALDEETKQKLEQVQKSEPRIRKSA